jgi:hypothetical protein
MRELQRNAAYRRYLRLKLTDKVPMPRRGAEIGGHACDAKNCTGIAARACALR